MIDHIYVNLPRTNAGHHVIRFIIPDGIYHFHTQQPIGLFYLSKKGRIKDISVHQDFIDWANHYTPGWQVRIHNRTIDLCFISMGHATFFKMKYLL